MFVTKKYHEAEKKVLIDRIAYEISRRESLEKKMYERFCALAIYLKIEYTSEPEKTFYKKKNG